MSFKLSYRRAEEPSHMIRRSSLRLVDMALSTTEEDNLGSSATTSSGEDWGERDEWEESDECGRCVGKENTNPNIVQTKKCRVFLQKLSSSQVVSHFSLATSSTSPTVSIFSPLVSSPSYVVFSSMTSSSPPMITSSLSSTAISSTICSSSMMFDTSHSSPLMSSTLLSPSRSLSPVHCPLTLSILSPVSICPPPRLSSPGVSPPAPSAQEAVEQFRAVAKTEVMPTGLGETDNDEDDGDVEFEIIKEEIKEEEVSTKCHNCQSKKKEVKRLKEEVKNLTESLKISEQQLELRERQLKLVEQQLQVAKPKKKVINLE